MAAFLYDMSEALAFLAFIGFLFGVAMCVVITGVVLHEAVRFGISMVKLRLLHKRGLGHDQFRAHPEQHRVSGAFVP